MLLGRRRKKGREGVRHPPESVGILLVVVAGEQSELDHLRLIHPAILILVDDTEDLQEATLRGVR